MPGVGCASLSGGVPLAGGGGARMVNVEGPLEGPEDRRYVSVSWVAPKYFETLGTPLLAGRDFSFQDQGRPHVAIVNQAMARYYFGGGNPIGKHVALDGIANPYEIVGGVRDDKYYHTRHPTPRP